MDEFANKGYDQNQLKSSSEVGNREIDKSPWSGLFIPIIMGFILQSVQFNFLLLQYILPLLGSVLIYLGIRDLRGENRWFRLAWYCAILFLVLFGLSIITMATHWNLESSEHQGVSVYGVFGVLERIVLIGFFLTMRKGIQEFFNKAGMMQNATPLLGVAILLSASVVGALALSNDVLSTGYFIIALVMLVVFIILGIALWGLAKDLDAAGVAAEHYPSYATNRFRGGVIVGGTLVVLLVLVICVSFFENHPGVQGVAYTVPAENSTRAALIQQGILKDILAIIPNESLNLLSKADGIQIKSEVLNLEGNENASDDLHSTTILFHISSDTVYALEYFQWTETKAYWNDGFVIWGDGKQRILDSRLIYEDGGVLYEMAIPRLYQGKKRVRHYLEKQHTMVSLAV